MGVIETELLTKHYGKVCALENLSLTLEEHDVFGYIGPNGAGKTTTLRILATLLAPTSGTARIGGFDIRKKPQEVKRLVGFMPDVFGVYDGMRLWEYLDFFAAAYRIPVKRRKEMIESVLSLTDLTEKADDFVSSFSRGMKQRACVAKTLIHDPKVLLLDEPAAGLDPRARIEMRELVTELGRMGKTVLISSHILSELADMCNKIGILERGRLLACGTVQDVFKKVREHRVVEIQVLGNTREAEEALREQPGVKSVESTGDLFRIETTQTDEELASMLAMLVERGAKPLWQKEVSANLEEIFMKITEGKLA